MVGRIFMQDDDGAYYKNRKNDKIKKINKKTLFDIYGKMVRDKTNENSINIKGIENRDFIKQHIDHKISIYYGFKNNISFDDIAHISNLRMLDYKENMLKGKKCFVDEENSWIVSKYNLKI